ncbi:M50 family metallopeptidase, partial [Streptomyces sp. NPDC059233]
LLSAHRITLLLWVATALLAVMLVKIRNAYGVLTVVLTGATFVLVSWLAPAEVQAAFAYGVVWFLLMGGVRPVFELGAKRRHGGAPDSDADQLGRLTHLHPVVWLLFFHVVALCSLTGGGRWLLGL